MLARQNQPSEEKGTPSEKGASFAVKLRKGLTVLGILSPKSLNAPDSRLPAIRHEREAAESYEKLIQELERELSHAYDAFHRIGEPTFETVSNIRGGLVKLIHSDYANGFEKHCASLETHLLELQNHVHAEFPDALSKIGTALEEARKHFLIFAGHRDSLKTTKLDLVAYEQIANAQVEKHAKPDKEDVGIPLEDRKSRDAAFLMKSAGMPSVLREIIFAARRIQQSVETAKTHTMIIAQAARASLEDFREMELSAKLTPLGKAERRLELGRQLVLDHENTLAECQRNEKAAETHQIECARAHAQAREHLESDPTEMINDAFDATFGIGIDDLDFIELDEAVKSGTKTIPGKPKPRMVPPEKSPKRLHLEAMTVKLDAATNDLQRIRSEQQVLNGELKEAHFAIPALEAAVEAANRESKRIFEIDRAASIKTWAKRSAWAVLIVGSVWAMQYANQPEPNVEPEPDTLPPVPTVPVPTVSKPIQTSTPKPERLPEPTPEPLSPGAIEELKNLSYKVLGPLRMSDADIIIEVVAETVQGNSGFVKKWNRARTPKEKEALLDEIYSKVPEVKKVQMGRELMLTIGVLMQSAKLATKFTPELYRDILEAVYDHGWSEADEKLREKIVEEVLMSDHGDPKKSKEEIIRGFLDRLQK